MGQLVRDLAETYISRSRYEDAIRTIERLVNETGIRRQRLQSRPTFETKSRAYWQLKNADAAKAAILEGLRRFRVGWQADRLRQTLERYEKESQPGL